MDIDECTLMNDVTQILDSIKHGDPVAADQLLPLVYDELRRLAAQRLADERPGLTLQPTALVHEAYVRLVGAEREVHWESRGHFFAAAAEAMRRILVDNARRKQRLKRGGDCRRVDLNQVDEVTVADSEELLDLDEALNALAAEDPAKAELVKLRFYAGLSIQETASCLRISRATAVRHWTYARAWLYDRMRSNDAEAAS